MLILCLMLGLGCISAAAAQDDSGSRQVKVAFYPLDGFFEYDDSGKEVGYGVELLDKISQYTGVSFTYVKADSWESTKNMLMEGRADLRMPATKPATPSTALSYNNTSIIATYDALMTLGTREDLYYQDYDEIQKLKIAVSKDFYEKNSVQSYLDTVGIRLDQLVFCTEYNECREKLTSGEVDALISNIMDLDSEMKLLARFSNTYNYFSMRMDDPDIRMLDNALTEIQLDEPNFFSMLYAKWYPKRTTVPFTREESDYLQSLKTLTFGFRVSEGYLSHYENGQFSGIYVEMAKTICENLGVGFQAVSLEDCLAGKETADVYAGFFFDNNYAREMNYSITAPINDIKYYVIQKRERVFDEKTCRIAVLDKFRYTRDYIRASYPDADIRNYESYEDCLKAVENGQADMTIINNYIAEYYLNLYQFNDLGASLSEAYSHLYCLAAVNRNELLASLLTKGLYEISDDEMDQIYIRGQQDRPVTNVWMSMIYSNPVQVILAVVVFLALIFTIVFLSIDAMRRKKQNAELAGALSAKSDFLSRMSHDMRTPMNGILGLTTLLKDQAMSKAVRDGIGQIQLSGEYLLDLINDTLDMSKIESGHLELHPLPTSVKEVTENTITNAKLMADQKGVDLTVEILHPEKAVPVNLMIDRSRVEQIFMNLVSNAVKFTPEGGHVYVSIERLETAEQYIRSRYVISDTGIGMSEEFLKHLYEPFSQEGRMHTDRESGTGLGLSIVKQIVDLMGGELQVESTENVGTTFTLTIPFERYLGTMQKEELPAFDEDCLKGCRVLLCEDHPLNRQIAERLLQKKGILVDCAEDGSQGAKRFERSERGHYDAILMDLRMPVMDGYEATAAIRSMDRPDAATVPIIAMTANAFDEDVKKCMEAGMNAHIAKPIDVDRMYRTIAEQIKERKNRQ